MAKKLTLSELMSNDTKAIVASNLVLASTIMAAAGKPWAGDPFSSVSIEEAVKAFNLCASLLKDEG